MQQVTKIFIHVRDEIITAKLADDVAIELGDACDPHKMALYVEYLLELAATEDPDIDPKFFSTFGFAYDGEVYCLNPETMKYEKDS